VAIGNNPGTSALSGTATATAVAGVASFPGLSLNKTGTGYTLTANGGALTQATSSAFDITPGAAASVAFVAQPTAVIAGASIAPAVTVEIRDALGNRVTTSAASVTVAIGTNVGGGTLSGTLSQNAVAGLATFSNLSINRSGVGYTLAATSGVLTGPASSVFSVDPGAASALAITTMPTTGTNGLALTPAAVVRLVDAQGNTVLTTGTSVTALLSSGAGTLGGTMSASTTNGVATFSNLVLTGLAGPYTINFGSTGLTGITSPAVTLSAGAATTIAANSTPGASGTIGSAVTPLPAVRVTDGGSNPVSGVAVTFAVTAGNGAITGGATTTDVTGVATVGSWTRDLVVGVDTLTATAAGLTGSPVRFTTTGVAGAANSIIANSVTTQSATAGTAVGAPPSVLVRDVGLNPVAGVSVTFAVTAGSGSVVGGAATTNGSGIATLTSWTLGSTAGTNNNTVTATAAGLPASPVLFTASGLAGAANTIAANSPVSQTDTVGLPVAAPPSVIVTDFNGNPVSGVPVTFAVTGGGGSIVPVTATPVVTGLNGIATLTSWTLGTGTAVGGNIVTATAAVPSGSPVTFTATGVAGVPAALTFGVQPTGTTVGAVIAPAVTVRVVDAYGNLTTSTASVGLVIGSNPGVATLGGTPTRTAVAGVATFNDLTLNASGVGYTLNASSTGLPTIPSATFNIGVAATTTAISSDLPDPSVTGQPVVVNFSVTSGGGTPTGTVTVSDGTVSCNAAVATGNCALTFLTVGPKTITASYPGNTNFGSSSSAGAAHTVNQAGTTSLLASHTPNPSTRGAPVAVTWAIAAAAPGTGAPTGTVTVSDGVDSCNAALPAAGCSITLTTVGARTLTATYAGDANYITSVSPGVAHTVNPTATTTGLASSANPSVFGQSTTFTATVTGGTPTGTVQFKDGAANLGTPVTLVAGVAALPIATLSVTSHSVTAVYGGDANYATSTSNAVTQVVNLAATTTTILSHTPDPSNTADAVVITWAVTPVGPGAGAPTGNVTVTDGVDSCTADASAGGCTIPALTTSGTRSLVATYIGSTQFAGSTSAGVSHVVN